MSKARILWGRSFALVFVCLVVCLAMAIFTRDRDESSRWLFYCLPFVFIGMVQYEAMQAEEDDAGEEKGG